MLHKYQRQRESHLQQSITHMEGEVFEYSKGTFLWGLNRIEIFGACFQVGMVGVGGIQ